MTFYGFENLTGRTINGLRVLQIARFAPELAYTVECEKCGAQGVHLHRRLMTGAAKCGNGLTCARIAHERAAEQAERIATEQRQQAEQSEAKRDAQRATEQHKQARQQTDKIQSDYRKYFLHALNVWDQSPDDIMRLATWQQIGVDGRRRILETIQQESYGRSA